MMQFGVTEHRCELLAQVNGSTFHQTNGPQFSKVCATWLGFSAKPAKISHFTNPEEHAIDNIYSYTRNLDIEHLYLHYFLWLNHIDCYNYLKRFKYTRNHKGICLSPFQKNCKNSFSFRIKFIAIRWLRINCELLLLALKIS